MSSVYSIFTSSTHIYEKYKLYFIYFLNICIGAVTIECVDEKLAEQANEGLLLCACELFIYVFI